MSLLGSPNNNSESPAIAANWLTRSDLRERINADFYSPEYVRLEQQIMSCPTGCTRLGELINKPFKGAFYVLASEYSNSGIPFIRVGDITKGYVDVSKCVYLPTAVHDREKKTAVRPGTILFAKGGSIGNCAVVPDWIVQANISQDIIGAVPKTSLDAYFAVALLTGPYGIPQMLRWIQRATHPHLSNESITNVLVPNASRPVQIAIGNLGRAAERLQTMAEHRIKDAITIINRFIKFDESINLAPNDDGSCDYFSDFIAPAELGLYHGAQFFAPKRKLAVRCVRSSQHFERIGDHGQRIRAKGKRSAESPHLDPAAVSGGDGYWKPNNETKGGDIAFAKSGNVLFMRMRPYLNKITINDLDETASTSPEFLVYEFDKKDAYYAALCLRQSWALAQVAEIATGDRPRVDGEFVDDVIVPWPDQAIRVEVGNLYSSSFALRRRADSLVQNGIADIGRLILGTLDETACINEGHALANEFGLELPQ